MMSWRSLLVGIVIFIVFSQILEKIVHFIVLSPTGTELKWSSNPYLFALYGGLAAGIFEEIGRYFAFKVWLKNNHQFNDGLSYGLGHGGIEAIFIGGMSALNSLLISSMIKTGNLETILGLLRHLKPLTTLKSNLNKLM